jgi:hypothetical protein
VNPVGIESVPCPSRSPDGDPCMRSADHLNPHRRETDGRRWTGGVFRPAVWATGYVSGNSAAHYTPWGPLDR